ncbi:MAG: DUF2171 domain-containing protein [Sphingobium sp.]
MFEKLRIKEHMEIADAGGRHVGVVDSVDGDTIKLTRSDSSDGQHHYFSFDAVDRIEDNRVYLKDGVQPQIGTATAGVQQQGGAAQQTFGSGQTIDPDTYTTQRPSAGNPSADTPLFGTGNKAADI